MWCTRNPPTCSALPLSLFLFPQLVVEESAELCNFMHVEQRKKGMKDGVGGLASFAANYWNAVG